MNCYIGIDIGSISTKGVIIDGSNNIIASIFGFKPEPFFEANDADRETPKVQF